MHATTVIAVLMLTLTLTVSVALLTSEAQPAGKVPRVGVIVETSANAVHVTAFGQGLDELGYIEGQNIVVEYRYAHGLLDRVPQLAAELIGLDVDVLVVGGTVSAQSAKAVTRTVPVVFTLAGDPVGSGLVASLARPGGNATGLSNVVSELSGKQLELLKAAAPRVSRVTVLYNPVNPVHRPVLDGAREAARALALELQFLEVRQPNQLASAFSALTAWRAGALLAMSDPVIGSELAQLAKLAAQNRLPAIYSRRGFAEAGGLLAYGPSFSDNYRRAAGYVDKILKGARPADLPVQRPTKFELIINLKTAKALGLTIPRSLLLRTDQIIE
jgi:putative ABC transport system substrate-binding protein